MIYEIMEELVRLYPEVKCELMYNEPHELLIATRLSAQCTDKRVNQVTPPLFAKYKTIQDFASADIDEVQKMVNSCGLGKTKATDIVLMCRILHDKYSDTVPDSIDELVKLPGVGRKTANLIIGDLYGKPAVVTDTHVIRLSNRLGLVSVNTKEPKKVEEALRAILPEDKSLGFCHRLVWHGRLVCTARSPKCTECTLKEHCVLRGGA